MEDSLDNQIVPSRNYGGSMTEKANYSSLSLRKKMELENVELQKKIDLNKEMMKLLDENPAIEKFMDLSRGILR